MNLRSPIARPKLSFSLDASTMYSCSNWGLCLSGFLNRLHDSQKSVLAYHKRGKLAAGIRVPATPTWPVSMQSFLRHERKISRLFDHELFPQIEVGVSSSRVLLRCLFNLPFRHRWSWKLCPLLKTVLAVITPRRTKVFLGRFCSCITRSATVCQGLPRSATVCQGLPRVPAPWTVFASASIAGHWRRIPACTCKEKREEPESMIISRSQKTCPEIQLSELPLRPEMKRLSRVLGRSSAWSASALCTEKFEGFLERRILGVRAYPGLR